jgi:hypothetical protein
MQAKQLNYTEAEKALRRAAEVLEETQGIQHATIPYQRLGSVLSDQGRHDEAESVFKKVSMAARKSSDPTMIKHSISCSKLANNKTVKGKTTKPCRAYVVLRKVIGDALPKARKTWA